VFSCCEQRQFYLYPTLNIHVTVWKPKCLRKLSEFHTHTRSWLTLLFTVQGIRNKFWIYHVMLEVTTTTECILLYILSYKSNWIAVTL
jgi:hypothetical protein